MRAKLGYLLVLCCLTLGGQGLAAEWQDPGAIRAAAEAFASQSLTGFHSVKISASSVDERTRLPRCGAPLQATSPRGLSGGQGIVAVSCPAPKQWQLFVPVRASYLVEVLVARHSLRRGQLLVASDLRIEQRESSGLPAAYLTRPEEATGMTLRRAVPGGTVLNPAALEAPRAVRRGDLVTLIAGNTGVVVKSEGHAIEDGTLNQRVRVRTRSGRIVEGTVGPDNQVFIGAAARQIRQNTGNES
ncbi:MAG: flagellar basal body P-ring formation protein FlgA [Gammaproteobacteria bacterium]|nr:flagellar basal body P-ring formation protein FlgA [Gammaproteobacteria bacterium]